MPDSAQTIADALRESYYRSPDGRWFFSWDEDASSLCVWPWECEETTRALATFGDDEDEAAPQIFVWLAQHSSSPETP